MQVSLTPLEDAICLVEIVWIVVMLVPFLAIQEYIQKIVPVGASIYALMSISVKRSVTIQSNVHRAISKCQRQSLNVIMNSLCHVVLILKSFLVGRNVRRSYHVDTPVRNHVDSYAPHSVE